MVASSYTIDLTGRPPVRRKTSGVLSIDPEGLHSFSREPDAGAADAGNPEDIVALHQHRPGLAPAPGDSDFLKAANDEPTASGPERLQLLSRGPPPNGQRLG